MGIDFFDLQYHLEKEFGIRLEPDDLFEIVESREALPSSSFWGLIQKTNDIRFHEIVKWVRISLENASIELHKDIYERVKKVTVATLCLDDDEVTSDALLIHDLGMD